MYAPTDNIPSQSESYSESLPSGSTEDNPNSNDDDDYTTSSNEELSSYGPKSEDIDSNAAAAHSTSISMTKRLGHTNTRRQHDGHNDEHDEYGNMSEQQRQERVDELLAEDDENDFIYPSSQRQLGHSVSLTFSSSLEIEPSADVDSTMSPDPNKSSNIYHMEDNSPTNNNEPQPPPPPPPLTTSTAPSLPNITTVPTESEFDKALDYVIHSEKGMPHANKMTGSYYHHTNSKNSSHFNPTKSLTIPPSTQFLKEDINVISSSNHNSPREESSVPFKKKEMTTTLSFNENNEMMVEATLSNASNNSFGGVDGVDNNNKNDRISSDSSSGSSNDSSGDGSSSSSGSETSHTLNEKPLSPNQEDHDTSDLVQRLEKHHQQQQKQQLQPQKMDPDTSMNASRMPILSTVPTVTQVLSPRSIQPSLPDWKDYQGSFENVSSSNNNSTNSEQDEDTILQQTKENARKSFQQSVNSAVLVSLAHKRYERRRLAAMEIEKVVRGLVQNTSNATTTALAVPTTTAAAIGQQQDIEKVKAILLLLTDDYIRSTNEDARKGGVVALAACAIGLKKAHEIPDMAAKVNECKDIICASVIHACQDNSQRVRYYATESLFNVIKVIPVLAVEHFFILFEILRSLWADVDVDVRSGAELLDKKLKEVIVGAINTGHFEIVKILPLFVRFAHINNKPTKRLTLSWLQEFSSSLIGAPMLEFLFLFLNDIFAMLADPNSSIRQSALQFLNSILPQLLKKNQDFEDPGAYNKVDFDKILQSLVMSLEHPDPFVRKVGMYWMKKVVEAHMEDIQNDSTKEGLKRSSSGNNLSMAALSVRNSLPHVLPGILLCVGDHFKMRPATKDNFLPEITTHLLADETNKCLQNTIRREGKSHVAHLDGFIISLREELEKPGGLSRSHRSAIERSTYRMDVKPDGTGIESTGWFRVFDEVEDDNQQVNSLSCLCALDWVLLLFEHVVPESLKDEYCNEFVAPVIRLLEDAPEDIVLKSLEVLSKITVFKKSDIDSSPRQARQGSNVVFQLYPRGQESEMPEQDINIPLYPMTDQNALFGLSCLKSTQSQSLSRNRHVFSAVIYSHSQNNSLHLSRIIRHMCTLQPPEFVFVSFALELNIFVLKMQARRRKVLSNKKDSPSTKRIRQEELRLSRNLDYVTKFVQVMMTVLLNSSEAKSLRDLLKDCIGSKGTEEADEQITQIFHILLNIFAHDIASAVGLCLWSCAFRTASTFLHMVDPLDLNLMLYIELDQLILNIERPIFRDLHLRVLECNENPGEEGSGAMLFFLLKSILMLLPCLSSSFRILQQRLMSMARFRQSAVQLQKMNKIDIRGTSSEEFVQRIVDVRKLHCDAKWRSIRSESLEPASVVDYEEINVEESRRNWLGYNDEEDEKRIREKFKDERRRLRRAMGNDTSNDHTPKNIDYRPFNDNKEDETDEEDQTKEKGLSNPSDEPVEDKKEHEGNVNFSSWKQYWEDLSVTPNDTL